MQEDQLAAKPITTQPLDTEQEKRPTEPNDTSAEDFSLGAWEILAHWLG